MFPKVLKKILWILLWGGLLAFPTLEASAQFDASAILRNQNNQNPNDPNNPNNMPVSYTHLTLPTTPYV